MKKILPLLVILLVGIITNGCSQKLSSEISPGVQVSALQSFYVVHFSPEKRNLHKIIENQLVEMGYKATSGEEQAIPDDANVIVTYIDNWQWDITNYMIKIQITFKNPSGSILATATSYRTSLVRKTPPEMIKETLLEIFNPQNPS